MWNSVSHNASLIWICNEGAQMDSLFHGPNSIEYYSTIFLLGVSLWGTWNCLPHGRRTESIVVTRLNLEMKAWHLSRPQRLTVMDQLSSVVKMQKGDVSFRLTAEVTQVCQSLQWPLTDNVNSAIQPHLSIATLPTDTQSTTGDSWPSDPGRGLEFWHVYSIH